MVCTLRGPSAAAIAHVALKYAPVESVVIRDGHIQPSIDVATAYTKAMEKMGQVFDELQRKYNTHEGSIFFSTRSVQVWKEVLADADTVILVNDIRVLSEIMQVKNVARGLFSIADPKRPKGMFESHNKLMDTIELHVSSCRLHGRLDAIAAKSAAGVSILDSVQVDAVTSFIADWKNFLVRFPSESHSVEFLSHFKEVVKVSDISLLHRIYFHVWDQAVKAGECPAGDNWGAENAFKDMERLQNAIKLAEDELLSKAREFSPPLTKPRTISEEGDPIAYIQTSGVLAV